MELFEKIITLLDENKVEYTLTEHLPVFTSEEAAAVRKDFSLHQGAKAMVLKIVNSQLPIDNCFVMCVLPGDRKIDFKKLKSVLGGRDVKIGAVSPFGNLSDLKVLLDESIYDNEEIVFNAGDHCKSVKMKLSDYLRLVSPDRLSFSK